MRVLRPGCVPSLLLAGALFAPPVLAGPLERAVVDAQATWVVHIDLEAAARSLPGRALLEMAEAEGMEARERFTRDMGFDPLHVGRGLTVYGLSYADDAGVAVLTASAEAEKAADHLAKAPLEGYSVEEVEGVRVHAWVQDGRSLHAAILPGAKAEERRVVFASSREKLLRAARVVGGQEPGLAGEYPIDAGGGEIVAAAATGMNAEKPAAGGARATILRGAERMRMRLVERAGEGSARLEGEMTLEAVSPQRAQAMGSMLQGVVATLSLLAADDPEMQPLAEIAAGIEVRTEDRAVRVTTSHDAAKAAGLVRSVLMTVRSPEGSGVPVETGGKEPGDARKP